MQRRLVPSGLAAPVFLLCCLLWTTARAQRPTPLFAYQPEMHFYFPPDSVRQADHTVMPGYSDDQYPAIIFNPFSYDTYDQLATRSFRLASIQNFRTYDISGIADSILSYVLVDVRGLGRPEDTIYFAFQVPNPLAISRREPRNKQSLVLPGAVLQEDVDAAKTAYVGKHFFTKFSVPAGKKKLKYQEVVITDVQPGTVYAPVRLVYETRWVDTLQSKDVVTSGTNVLPVFWKGYLFGDSFQLGNPRDSVEKIDDAGWELICQGQVAIGMTSKQVVAALGMPDKNNIHRQVTAAGETDEWDYDKEQVTLEGDKVTKLVFGTLPAKK